MTLPGTEHDWLTTKEAAALLRLSPLTLRRWLRTGRLPATKFPGKGGWRIARETIRQVLEAGVPTAPGQHRHS